MENPTSLGGLATRISQSVSARGTPSAKSNGLQAAAEIGAPRSENGSVLAGSVIGCVEPLPAAMSRLAGLRHTDLDMAVRASLPLRLVWDEQCSTAWELTGCKVSGPREDLMRAKTVLQAMMRPLPADDLPMELSRMEALTVRPSTLRDVALVAAAYLERLSEYPADAVLWALREWPRRSKWFPAWKELEVLLEERTAPRRMMLEAVERAL